MRGPVLFALFLAALLPALVAGTPVRAAALQQPGELIYREGLRADGNPIVAERPAARSLRGIEAACVSCHRRSGMGTSEGASIVPPITSEYLAQARDQHTLSPGMSIAPGYLVSRAPFDDVSLARAIRDGVLPGGGKLGFLMPRYRIDDASMAALIAYLKTLGAKPAPGVAEDAVHFATVVTPEADAGASAAMLGVLEHYFAAPPPYAGGPRLMQHPHRMVGYRTGQRKWVLHVWSLKGPPAGWTQQLEEKLAAEPVFALISGVAGRHWEPVYRFCERARIPCLLPNVDLPVAGEGTFYSVYFSRGVLLEADLAAHWLEETASGSGARRVVQIYRRADVGPEAAGEAHAALQRLGILVVERPLDERPAAWREALAQATAGDALLLWIRGRELTLLPPQPPAVAAIVISGRMAGLQEASLPAPWRAQTRMTFTYDLPDRTEARMAPLRAWLAAQQLSGDERIEADTYLACNALAEMLGQLLDTWSRDLLVERMEDMLGQSINTAHYPRLGLAPGQRFASKGGYVVRFGTDGGSGLVPEGDWTAP